MLIEGQERRMRWAS